MSASSPSYLPALAVSRRPQGSLAVEDVSLAPVARVILFLIALSLPVLGSVVADHVHDGDRSSGVGALAALRPPLGGAARKPDTTTTASVTRDTDRSAR